MSGTTQQWRVVLAGDSGTLDATVRHVSGDWHTVSIAGTMSDHAPMGCSSGSARLALMRVCWFERLDVAELRGPGEKTTDEQVTGALLMVVCP